MEQYTDDERVEDLKKWWKENGTSIIVGIGLGLVAIFGWQYWNAHRNTKAEQASQAYDAFVTAAEKPDPDQARQLAQSLLADFPKSPYAALAALRLAKLAAESGDSATAIQRLEWVIENARLDEIKDIARLRLARVLAAAGRAPDAELQLARVATPGLTAEREELRGDLALAGNDPDKARTAYTAALAASGGNFLLQLKLDNLAPPTADSVIAAPAAPTEPPEPPASVTPPAAPPPAAPAASPETAPLPGSPPAAPAATPGPAGTPPPASAEPMSPALPAAPTPPASDSVTAPAPATPAPTTGQ